MYRYIALFLFVLGFSFCTKKKRAEDIIVANKYKSPDTTGISSPFITQLDTCPKPYVIEIPEKGEKEYTIAARGHTEAIKVKPPKVNPLSGWNAGEYTFGADYNSDQSITLTGISCGCMDRLGNLWFGTFGGGVSRYDGNSVTNFTMAQGLAGNLITAIKEDKNGNLWFGTNGNGISKYDGKRFYTYTTADGLSGNLVRSIAEDSAGNIWFGSEMGLSMYPVNVDKISKNKQFINYTIDQGLVHNIVLSSVVDKSGNIWFGTKGGLSKCVKNNERYVFENYTPKEGLISTNIISIWEDPGGNIWFGSDGDGLSKCTPETVKGTNRIQFINYTEQDGLVDGNIQAMNTDAEGNVWFATGNGLSKLVGIQKEKKGSDKALFVNYSAKNSLVSQTVHSVTKDRNGNLWFGTASSGLNKYERTPLTTITEKHGLESGKIWSMCEDKNGDLWIGTGYGIIKYDSLAFTSITAKHLTSTVRSIIRDKQGNIWWGGVWGLTKFDGKTTSTFTEAHGISEAVLCIVEDKKGNLWFGTYGQGLFKYDGKNLINYTTAHGLNHNTVKCITEDNEGNIWMGTNGGGICKFDGKQFISYKKEQGLSNNTVLSCLLDGNGNLWFGTGGGGINRFVGNTGSSGFFKSYTSSDGLPNDIVFAMAEDTVHNKIWFGTNLGIAALNKDSVGLDNSKINFEIYNKNNGYPIRDLNTGALYVDKKGVIWAGTGEKFVRFDYDAIHRSSLEPVVVIKGVKISGEPVMWSGLKYWQDSKDATYLAAESSDTLLVVLNEEAITFSRPLSETERIKLYKKFDNVRFDSVTPFYPVPLNLVLPYSNNQITFEFAAIETGKSKLVRYQFMLEGYDKTWRTVTEKSSADYGNINEGIYTFKLKAQSPSGVWCTPVLYTFKVLPPWYRTWWMYLIYIVSALLTFVFVFRWRTTALRKDKEVLERTVAERTTEVLEQKKLVEKKNVLIEEKQKEMVDSINYAKRIQYALLAHEKVLKQHLKNHFVFFQPKDIVSGDFYWATEVQPNRVENDSASAASTSLFYLAICDSTGHGVPGAFMSLLNMSFLNEAINEKNIRKPNEILNHVRQRLIENISQDGAQDGMDGVLLCFEHFSSEGQNAELEKKVRITYAAANNAPVLIRENELIELPYDRMPVGKGERNESFALHTMDVKKSDTVYCFTDGYADQFGGPKGKKFKTKQLNNLLLSIHQKSMKKQQHLLGTTIENWKSWSTFSGQSIDIQEQVDDILIIGLQID